MVWDNGNCIEEQENTVRSDRLRVDWVDVSLGHVELRTRRFKCEAFYMNAILRESYSCLLMSVIVYLFDWYF